MRPRYRAELAPVVFTRDDTGELVFYKNDGKTPLDTPPDIVEHEGKNPLTPYLENSTIDSAGDRGGNAKQLDESFEEHLTAVLGPSDRPKKRQKITNINDTVPPTTTIPLHSQVEDTSKTPTLSTTPSPVITTDTNSNANNGKHDNKHLLDNDSIMEQTSLFDRDANYVPITQDSDEDNDEPQNDDILLQQAVSRQLERVAEESTNDEEFIRITSHDWSGTGLNLGVEWSTGEVTFCPFHYMKLDYPEETAIYILDHKVGASNNNKRPGRFLAWARSFQREIRSAVRRLIRLEREEVFEEFSKAWNGTNELTTDITVPNPSNSGQSVPIISRRSKREPKHDDKGHHLPKSKGKPGRTRRQVDTKYGIRIPQNVKEAYAFDAENKNKLWSKAIEDEIASLKKLCCFSFHSPNFRPSSDFNWTTLHMNFELKECGRRKARLVAGGHLVSLRGIHSRSTVVRGVSVRILDVIAHSRNYSILCGDIGNAFITAPCLEKVWSRCGPEFGELEDYVVIIEKALYGLKSSARAFRLFLADYIRKLGFFPSRCDRDVWMRMREEGDGYDYVCTHVDDFKVWAKHPERWAKTIGDKFQLKVVEKPRYYLGADYSYSEEHKGYYIGSHTYIKECIRKVEAKPQFAGKLHEHKTPMPEGVHPESDNSELLDLHGICTYQMLIGMLQWANCVCRFDIAYAISSLSRFNVNPRVNHLKLALHVFGYLKKHPNRRILVDSRPLIIDDPSLQDTSFHYDFMEDYEGACEDEECNFPEPFGEELDTSVFWDADHAHDLVTRRSISGIFGFIGSTPVFWKSSRQGCIASSTYCSEFIAMRTAVEETISMRYMLRCFGVPITKPTRMYGDNKSVLDSVNLPQSEMKKKHIAIFPII